ncbi:hypothetical protein GDO81_011929 [Engystomops pustulosus]|uniref:Uncharacterized protein n=1 Tax=Engystomops pustulosus TaxID=76066 RepID=A0AAV7BIC7_ENGPU|nr:hypothetical protein GDO81_011929 [Engystomops pustulosus]
MSGGGGGLQRGSDGAWAGARIRKAALGRNATTRDRLGGAVEGAKPERGGKRGEGRRGKKRERGGGGGKKKERGGGGGGEEKRGGERGERGGGGGGGGEVKQSRRALRSICRGGSRGMGGAERGRVGAGGQGKWGRGNGERV